MKLLPIIFTLLFITEIHAIDFQWDANTDSATGYVFMWQETDCIEPACYGSGNRIGEHFNERIPGINSTTYTVPNNFMKPNVEYDFWVHAYNATDDMSGPSNVLKAYREVEKVPPDRLPSDVYNLPGGVINLTNQ